jgi:hypothetical protein
MAVIGKSIRKDIHDLNMSWIELRDHEGFNPQPKRMKSIELMIPHESVESFPMHVRVFVIAMVLGMINQEAGAAGPRGKKYGHLRLYLEFRTVVEDVVNFDFSRVDREET